MWGSRIASVSAVEGRGAPGKPRARLNRPAELPRSLDGGRALCYNRCVRVAPPPWPTPRAPARAARRFSFRCQRPPIVYAQFARVSKVAARTTAFRQGPPPCPPASPPPSRRPGDRTGDRPTARAARAGRFVLVGLRRCVLKIIDLCVVLRYNNYWRANKNASCFVAATNTAEAAGTLWWQTLENRNTHPPSRCGGRFSFARCVQCQSHHSAYPSQTRVSFVLGFRQTAINSLSASYARVVTICQR